MCVRLRHDFELPGSMTDAEKESFRRNMRRLYEEVAGYGYFQYPEGFFK